METVLLGDALEQLQTLEDESAYTCVTSPPYYNLRDYGTAGQIGAEDTPEEYIGKLVNVFREVRRVLRQDGTLWLNIGDSYATKTGRYAPNLSEKNVCGKPSRSTPAGYKHKDLIGIPWMLAFAMRADGWYLRRILSGRSLTPCRRACGTDAPKVTNIYSSWRKATDTISIIRQSKSRATAVRMMPSQGAKGRLGRDKRGYGVLETCRRNTVQHLEGISHTTEKAH